MFFLTVDKNGTHPSADLFDMAKAFELIHKKNPGSTVSSLPVLISIKTTPLFFAESRDLALSPKDATTPNWLSEKDGLAFLDKNSVLWIETNQGRHTMFVLPNGETSFHEGFLSYQNPDHTDPLKAQAEEWLAHGRVGRSSKTMCQVITGLPVSMKTNDYDHPNGPSDFKRCSDFLKDVPLARPHLDKLRSVNSVWNNLIDNWGVLETIMEKELQSAKSGDLHAKIIDLTSIPNSKPKF